jgi:serine/threonine protein phosphatase PrpC/transcriptional regulator of met regulon
MSQNQYNNLQFSNKIYKEKKPNPLNKNSKSAVVRINPANLNNYQQIIKNDQINHKNNHEIDSNVTRINYHLNYYSHKNNFGNHNNNLNFPSNLNNLGQMNNQSIKMKNTILKIRSDDQKENIFRINLREDRSADRINEPQRQLITADMIAKRRNDLNRSVNSKNTRLSQLYSATNRNSHVLNNHYNENKPSNNYNNNLNYASINNSSANNNHANYIMTINKNYNGIITPIHANINLNPTYNSKVKNDVNVKSKNENRLFSPIINENMSIAANQTQKKVNNAITGSFKINTNNPSIYTPNGLNSNHNMLNTNNNSSIVKNYNNNNNIKQILQDSYINANTGAPHPKDNNLVKESNHSSARERERDKKERKEFNLNYYSQKNNNNNNLINDKTKCNFFSDKKNFKIIDNADFTSENKTPSDSKDIYNPSAKSVKEYSYKEDRNSSFRNTMEDLSKIVDRFMKDNNKGLFGLFDGHGGSQTVKYVSERLPDIFSKFLNETKNNVEKSLIYTFQKLDEELKVLPDCENVGTTACVVYIFKDADIITGGRKTFYCANIGDTRCILVSSSGSKRMSYDHKCTDESEVARIRKVGGVVFNGRVFGQLALSRAFGDHAMKKYGVICTPHVNKHIVSEKDKFIVLCSDGVWDVLTDEDVYSLSLKIKNADEFSTLIVNTAIYRGSRDNISCIAITIN